MGSGESDCLNNVSNEAQAVNAVMLTATSAGFVIWENKDILLKIFI